MDMKNPDFFRRGVTVVINFKDVPYYRDENETGVLRANRLPSTSYVHRYATIYVAEEGHHLTLEISPWANLQRKNKSWSS